jgi:GT2 family glycosyltransferase/glycosyltransferase involved in cell wall biosynthesis
MSVREGNKAYRIENYRSAIELYRLAASRMPGASKLLYEAIDAIIAQHEIGECSPLVDIIIPVYNAKSYIQACLDSIIRSHVIASFRVIIVDDGSDVDTAEMLRDYSAKYGYTLIVNSQNRGYTSSVNSGIANSLAPFVVILNSDTQVTSSWLDKLVSCADSSVDIGIVGPLSNAASWQNVPHLYDHNGEFAVNQLPGNIGIEDMAGLIALVSRKEYPCVPIVNGFCYLIKREVIDKIGILNVKSFPTGYGEENDYCMRAVNAGFSVVVADDAYVWHYKSKSFGKDRKKALSRDGRHELYKLHGKDKVDQAVSTLKHHKVLASIRERVVDAIRVSSQPEADSSLPYDYSQVFPCGILYLMPCRGSGGGIHSVFQEALGIHKIGVLVNVAVRRRDYEFYLQLYSDIPEMKQILLPYSSDQDLVASSTFFDVAIATIFTSVKILQQIIAIHPGVAPAYYIQDYEPYFYSDGDPYLAESLASYTLIPNVIAFAKTKWLIEEVMRYHPIKVHKVLPSIDHEVYAPNHKTEPSSTIKTISAMVRPETPRRGPQRTLDFLHALSEIFGTKLSIEIFGGDQDHELFRQYSSQFDCVNHGVISRREVAQVLSRSSVFLDLSDYQAFGRTGLEAMACGCVPVLPSRGGVHEYAVHQFNSFIIDTNAWQNSLHLVADHLENDVELSRMSINAISTSFEYTIFKSSVSILSLLCSEIRRHRVF